jgi:thioredoxin reductase (NADPH)
MVTPEEVEGIPYFAALSPESRERLARTSADISLAAGEYAAHEGDARALFALLDGHIEVVKLVDGIPRLVGERHPGELIGEVPITLGTVFPVGFRASEPSRVMRIDPHDYHSIAAQEPELVKAVGALAGNRMSGPGGLSGIAAEPPRRGRSSSATAGTPRAPSCGASSTATRSRSPGSSPTRTMRSSSGAERCHPRPTAL